MSTLSTGGVKFLEHSQTVASATWVITHNFGARPVTETIVYVSGVLQKAFPLWIDHTDENTVTISWSEPRTGFATLLGDQSV